MWSQCCMSVIKMTQEATVASRQHHSNILHYLRVLKQRALNYPRSSFSSDTPCRYKESIRTEDRRVQVWTPGLETDCLPLTTSLWTLATQSKPMPLALELQMSHQWNLIYWWLRLIVLDRIKLPTCHTINPYFNLEIPWSISTYQWCSKENNFVTVRKMMEWSKGQEISYANYET